MACVCISAYTDVENYAYLCKTSEYLLNEHMKTKTVSDKQVNIK